MRISDLSADVGAADLISSASIRRDGVALFVQGLIWSVPPIFFAHPATPLELISLWTLTSCIMVGTALMYVGLPLSSIAFLSAVGCANAYMMLGLGSLQSSAVIVCYTLLLLTNVMKHARAYALGRASCRDRRMWEG